VIGVKSNYAYLLEWDELYAPAVVNEMLNAGLVVKVATNTFEIQVAGTNKKFDYGTILIPVNQQKDNAETLGTKINALAEKYRLKVYAITTGNVNTGSDLGSSKFIVVTKPSVAMIVGPGVNPTDAREVWHLLDQRINIPATHIEAFGLSRDEPHEY